jgi:hypothetical protein
LALRDSRAVKVGQSKTVAKTRPFRVALNLSAAPEAVVR